MPALRWTRTGLEITQGTGPALLLGLLDNVLRGIGQVMFQNNSYSGLLFLLAVATQSWVLALALLLGSAAATLTAAWLGAEHAPIRMGMFGFNGGLVALALLVFLQPSALTWGCALLAAAASSIVMAWMQRTCAIWKLPALTAPFVITTLCCFLAVARFGRLEPTGLMPTAELPQAATVEGVVTLTTLLIGVFKGVGQVFFQGSVISGLLLLAGLLWASPRAGIAAVLGSAVGALVAWGMGAAEPAIRAGMYGYNSALVAMALSCVFLRPSAATYAYALLAAAITPFVAAATMASLAPLGMPALTLPFVLVTWVFVLASTGFSRLQQGSTP
jgi:urea transporter